MITPITMYCANCDSCNRQREDGHNGYMAMIDISQLKEELYNSEWKEDDAIPGTYYCPDCYTINDNDEIVFKIDNNEKNN